MIRFSEAMIRETSVSEIQYIPSFFAELPESKEIEDSPVSKMKDSDSGNPIYMITRNEGLEGEVHPITGIPFQRRLIELPSGEVAEGVFPEFEAVFEARIPEAFFKETDYKQFKICNEQLYHSIERNSDLKGKFTEEQIEQIRDGLSDGTAPDGYVWHHDAEPGKIQLVDFETHANTGHTGGRTVWGGGNDNR